MNLVVEPDAVRLTPAASDKLHAQVPANRVGRAREGAQGHRFVVRIEQAVELGAAGPHAPGQHRLGGGASGRPRAERSHGLSRPARYTQPPAPFGVMA
jgi:hypothetical protein